MTERLALSAPPRRSLSPRNLVIFIIIFPISIIVSMLRSAEPVRLRNAHANDVKFMFVCRMFGATFTACSARLSPRPSPAPVALDVVAMLPFPLRAEQHRWRHRIYLRTLHNCRLRSAYFAFIQLKQRLSAFLLLFFLPFRSVAPPPLHLAPTVLRHSFRLSLGCDSIDLKRSLSTWSITSRRRLPEKRRRGGAKTEKSIKSIKCIIWHIYFGSCEKSAMVFSPET